MERKLKCQGVLKKEIITIVCRRRMKLGNIVRNYIRWMERDNKTLDLISRSLLKA